jgi:hypothetical protein
VSVRVWEWLQSGLLNRQSAYCLRISWASGSQRLRLDCKINSIDLLGNIQIGTGYKLIHRSFTRIWPGESRNCPTTSLAPRDPLSSLSFGVNPAAPG